MALSWEELDALIDETLAAGQPRMTMGPSVAAECVDNDGNPRRAATVTPSGIETTYTWRADDDPL